LEPYTRPEILSADLSSFVLDLAQWGASDPGKLAFLDKPPLPALNEARALLTELGAIDSSGRITDEGRRLRALPLPPRLARMVVDAAKKAPANWRRRLPLCSPNADSAATMSIWSTGSINSAATARGAPRTRVPW
jgi:HrpA-like RNA helicase